MSYSYSTDGESSDIELVSHPQPARAAASTGAHGDDDYAVHDYADFFTAADSGAVLPPALAQRPSVRPEASGSAPRSRQDTRMQTDKSDVIEIRDSDDDDDPDGITNRPPSYLFRPTGDLRKTHSAPSAVFGENGGSNAKGKQRLFGPLDSDDEGGDDDDELPNLGSIAARSNILKRANSDSLASLSATTGGPAVKRRFKYVDSSTRKAEDMPARTLSPIPASSPLPAFFGETSRDRVHTSKSGGLLPSDLDSSEDESRRKKQPKKQKAEQTSMASQSQGQPTSEVGPSKAKPRTKKQIQEEERAAKKALKDLERAKKAVSDACIFVLFPMVPLKTSVYIITFRKRLQI